MNRLCVAVSLAAAMFFLAYNREAYADSKQKVRHKDLIQGIWRLESTEPKSSWEPWELQCIELHIKSEEAALQLNVPKGKPVGEMLDFLAKPLPGKLALDEKKNPREFDFTWTWTDPDTKKSKKHKLPGLYDIDKDTLKLCFRESENWQKRPDKLAGSRETEIIIMVFKRVKQDNK